ncbi:MAG: DUF3237 family protein [Acidimicrobiia bacterium]
MPTLDKFCSIEADLGMEVIGKTPAGTRVDFPFQGVATSPHWEGERPVKGVDYVTVRGDGNMTLDIHGVIGEGKEAVSYRGGGVSIANPDRSADPKELIVFETGNEDLAWLNTEVAVGFGHGAGGRITIDVYLVRP